MLVLIGHVIQVVCCISDWYVPFLHCTQLLKVTLRYEPEIKHIFLCKNSINYCFCKLSRQRAHWPDAVDVETTERNRRDLCNVIVPLFKIGATMAVDSDEFFLLSWQKARVTKKTCF